MHRSILSIGLSLALSLSILISSPHTVQGAAQQHNAVGPAAPEPELVSSSPVVGYWYTIRPADTLWDIAAAHGISIETLRVANRERDPRFLLPGQEIFVPAQPVTMPQKPPIATDTASAPRPVSAAPTRPQAAPQAVVAPAKLPPEIANWPAEIMALFNAKRVAAGVPALAWSAELADVAQAHAEDCRQRGWGSHVGSDGATLRTRLARVGYPARWAGENWANMQSPQAAFALWWNEPPGADPHRSNILNSMYKEIGIGIVVAPWGYYFFADFGSR